MDSNPSHPLKRVRKGAASTANAVEANVETAEYEVRVPRLGGQTQVPLEAWLSAFADVATPLSDKVGWVRCSLESLNSRTSGDNDDSDIAATSR